MDCILLSYYQSAVKQSNLCALGCGKGWTFVGFSNDPDIAGIYGSIYKNTCRLIIDWEIVPFFSLFVQFRHVSRIINKPLSKMQSPDGRLHIGVHHH